MIVRANTQGPNSNFSHSNKMFSGDGGEILHRKREREGESQDRRVYNELKLRKSVILGQCINI